MTAGNVSGSDFIAEVRNLKNYVDELNSGQTGSLIEATEKVKAEVLREWTQQNTGPDVERDKVYDSVQSWVEGWFVHAYARSAVGGGIWCGEWWRHPEAVSRLTALWHSWEAAQKNKATGMAHWYVMYGDPIFGQLTDSRGTFVSCEHGHGRVLPSLATITVEDGYPRLP